jgi:hypothetical protein
MENSFKIGDKVRVIKYGHPMLTHKENYYKMQEYFYYQPTFFDLMLGNDKPKRDPYVREEPYIISDKGETFIIDTQHGLVGQEGVIDECSDGQYSVFGIPEKHAWYNEEQLELI